MKTICKKCSGKEKWLPTSVSKLEEFLSNLITSGQGVPNVSGLRKNIVYNLQYLQFQQQLLSEFDVTQVILTQTWKVHIIVGTSIIEAILYYLLTSKGYQKTFQWEEVGRTGNEVNIDGCKHRIENTIFTKLESPKNLEMNLDSMIKIANKKKLLGDNQEIYKKINYLRKLRNSVHLHAIQKDTDTDWWKINKNEIDTVKIVLYSFLTSSLFKPTESQKEYLEFLKVT